MGRLFWLRDRTTINSARADTRKRLYKKKNGGLVQVMGGDGCAPSAALSVCSGALSSESLLDEGMAIDYGQFWPEREREFFIEEGNRAPRNKATFAWLFRKQLCGP